MSKIKKLKQLKERFRDTLSEVAKIMNISEREVTRDEYVRISVDTNIKGRLNKEELHAIGGFKMVKELLFKITEEELLEIEKSNLISQYTGYISKVGLTPSLKTISSWGYNSRFITKNFEDLKGLYLEAKSKNPEVFRNLINDVLFTESYFKEVENKIKDKKVLIITTAVSGKEVSEKCLNSLLTYKKRRNAEILVLPCEDISNRKSTFSYELDSRLSDCLFVGRDLKLNNNIHVSSIIVSAKQINPLTGLERLAQSKGSAILASPKQYLSFVSTSNTKLPHALMTTGAITHNDYSTELYMSKRTSYLAEFDHIMGAIVVEIEDDNIYHFRQIQFDKDGSFYDLDSKYYPNNKVEKVKESTVVFGDTHVGSHDIQVDSSLQELTKLVKAKEIIVHDIFDNRFNNHHDIGKPVIRALLATKGLTSLRREGDITKEWLENWSKLVSKVTIVKSNHDEALDRYITEGRWLYDHENFYDALLLTRAKMDGEDVLKYLLTDICNLKSKNINWLKRDEDYSVYGIVNDAHGDKGANGSRGSLRNLEKSYFKATVGHSHTAGIFRNIYQVGTSTKMKLGYNSGPSSWTNTCCIQYPNGQRQLINFIRNNKNSVSFKIS